MGVPSDARTPVVGTGRVTIPPPGRAEVERTALLRELDRAWDVGLTVVVGPAGYGKTTTVAAWARRQPPGRVAWLWLDGRDADPTRFARQLHAALCTIGVELPALVTTGGAPVIDDAVLHDLAAELAGREPMVLVLDDLHALAGVSTLDDVARLVDGGPGALHVVVTSRREPPLGLSRRRVAGDLVEIRQAELALSDAETAQLLARLGAGGVDAERAHALSERTEGWAAGVQLAGVALRRDGAPDRLDELLLDDRHVVEYLTEEVLDRLDPPTRDYLLRISLLDVVDGPLADVVTGTTGGARRLEELARESLFLAPVDAAGTTYRFHGLFAELLRARLAMEAPREPERLLPAAAQELLGRGALIEAGELLHRAQAWPELLELIEGRGPALYESGETATVTRWIRSVPVELRSEPEHALRHAELLMILGAQGPAEIILDALDLDLLTPGQRAVVDTLRALTVLFGGRPRRCAEAATRGIEAIDRLDDGSWPRLLGIDSAPEVRFFCWFLRGVAELALDDIAAAVASASIADETSLGYPPLRLNAVGSHGLALALAGELDSATACAERGFRLAEETGFPSHWSVALCHLGAATAHLDGDRLDAARRHLTTASALLRRNGRLALAALAAAVDAELERAAGRPEVAITVIDAHRAATATAGPGIAGRLAAAEARALLDLGRSREATLVVERAPVTPATAAIRAQVAAETGDLEAMRRVVATWPEPDTRRLRFERDLWEAMLAQLSGHRGAGTRLEALASQVVADRTPRWLAGSGRTVRRSVRRTAEVRPTPALRQVAALLERSVAAPRSGADALVEPLTERELEVVAFLPTRLTNTEMAGELYISANTLKTHLARIYRKLGVGNRTEAIERCQELGLL